MQLPDECLHMLLHFIFVTSFDCFLVGTNRLKYALHQPDVWLLEVLVVCSHMSLLVCTVVVYLVIWDQPFQVKL